MQSSFHLRGNPGLSATVLLLLTLVLSLLPPATSPVAAQEAAEVTDQRLEGDPDCDSQTFPASTSVGQEFDVIAQSFIPQLSTLTSIDLCLDAFAPIGQATLTIVELDDDGQVIRHIGQPQAFTPQGDVLSGPTWTHVDLDMPRELVPDTTYAVRLETPRAFFDWLATCGTGAPCDEDSVDHYPRGSATPGGGTSDFGFRTYAAAAPDLVVSAISTPGLICPDPESMDGLTVTVDNTGTQGVGTFEVDLRLGGDTLGTATVSGGLGAGGSASLVAADFGDLEVLTELTDIRRDQLTVEVDPRQAIPSQVEDGDVASQAVTVVDCRPSLLEDLTAASSEPFVEAGLVELPFGALDPTQIAASAERFAGVQTTPFTSTPFTSTPFTSTPFTSTPFTSTPFTSTPFTSTPFTSTPFTSTPFTSTPFTSTELGNLFGAVDEAVLERILLVSVAAFDIDARLASYRAANEGTPAAAAAAALAELPVQDLTLADVLRRLDPALPIGLHEVDLSTAVELTPLGTALSRQPLDSIPAPAGHPDWCAAIAAVSDLACGPQLDPATATPMTLDVRAVPMSQFDVSEMPVAAITPQTASPLFEVPLASSANAAAEGVAGIAQPYRLSFTVLGSMRVDAVLTDLSLVPTCADGCDATIAEVEAAYGFAADLRLGSLIGSLTPQAAGLYTLDQALLGLIALRDLPWGAFDSDRVDSVAIGALIDEECTRVSWTASADVAQGDGLTAVVDPVLHVTLPRGFSPDEGSVTATADGAAVEIGSLIVDRTGPRAIVRVPISAIARHSVTTTIPACAAATLRTAGVDVSADWDSFTDDGTFGIDTAQADAVADLAPVAVIERDETDTPDTLRAPAAESLVLRHITTAEDVDFFSIPLGVPLDSRGSTLDPGDRLRVTLAPPQALDSGDPANPMPGSDFDLALFAPSVSPLRDAPFTSTPFTSTPLPVIPVDGAAGGADSAYGTRETDTVNDTPTGAEPVQVAPFASTPFTSTPFTSTPFTSTPFTSTPIRDVSAQRGDAVEVIDTIVRPGEVDGAYTVQVTGFNGDRSDRPYAMFVEVLDAVDVLGACTPPGGAIAPGDGLAPIDADIKSLLLVNRGQLVADAIAQHAADPELQASYAIAADFATAVLASLDALAAHPQVAGQVLAVDADPVIAQQLNDFRTTSAWCDPVAPNQIVGQLRRVVADARAAAPGLAHVVVVGSDAVLPMMRAWDGTEVANERSFLAQELKALGAQNGPSLAALAAGTFLTDDALDSSPIAWRDTAYHVPDLAIGRLVETPLDVMRQAEQFVLADGIVDMTAPPDGSAPQPITPVDALVTGYDFLTDGSQQAADGLTAGQVQVTTLINDAWTAADAITAIAGDQERAIAVLNGHADPTRLLSAAGDAQSRAGGSPDPAEVISTADLAGATIARVVAAASCHFGTNVVDAYAADGVLPTADWAQSLSQRKAVLIGSTGYGYGTFGEAPALSEGLVADLSAQMTRQPTLGQAWATAKQRFATFPAVYGQHHRKAGMELAFYGLTMYRLSTATDVGGPAAPTPQVEPVTGLDSVPLSTGDLTIAGPGCTACLERTDVAKATHSGSFFTAKGFDGDGLLAVEGQPLTAQATFALDLQGRQAGGFFITGVEAQDIPGEDGGDLTFNPLFARPIVSDQDKEVEPQRLGSAFPATASSARTVGELTAVSIPLTRFRGADVIDSQVVGQMTALTRVDGVLYLREDGTDDLVPPTTRTLSMRRADGALTGRPGEELVTLTVTLSDVSGTSRVASGLRIVTPAGEAEVAIELTKTSETPLAIDGGGTLQRANWGGGLYVPAGAAVEIVRVQSVDGVGNVGTAHNKLANPNVGGTGGTDPLLMVVGAPSNGWYGEQTSVLLDGAGDAYDIYIDQTLVETVTPNPGGPTVIASLGGDRVYQVTATPAGADPAAGTTIQVPVDSSPPEVTFTSPSEATFAAGLVVQSRSGRDLTIACSDIASGVATCAADIYRVADADASTGGAGGSDIDVSDLELVAADATSLYDERSGLYAVVATGTDIAGRVTERTVTYTVASSYSFNGFESPLRPFPQVRERTHGSTIPAKFTMYEGDLKVTDPSQVQLVWFVIDDDGDCGHRPTLAGLDAMSLDDAIEPTFNQDLQYGGGRFKANVSATVSGADGGCFALTAVAPDGSRLYALVAIDD